VHDKKEKLGDDSRDAKTVPALGCASALGLLASLSDEIKHQQSVACRAAN